MTSLLTVKDILCRYGERVVCEGLSFRVDAGALVSLLGPSGCGKTTVLRAIAGFEPVYAGSISLAGRELSRAGDVVPPEQRQVGLVFQDYALFPHLSVAGNIAFGLGGSSSAERERTVRDLLALTRLEEYAKAWPADLSGGQQQRVALARALAPRPRLLLLDEPFSNLDTELRRDLCLDVRELLKARGTTALLVTHDQSEAFAMADEIGVMAAGRLLQWDSPRQLCLRPASATVARFLGQGQLLPASRHGRWLQTPLGALQVTGLETNGSGDAQPFLFPPPAEQTPQAVHLLVRPWNLCLRRGSELLATPTARSFQGAGALTTLQLADGSLVQSDDPGFSELPLGNPVGLGLTERDLRFFTA